MYYRRVNKNIQGSGLISKTIKGLSNISSQAENQAKIDIAKQVMEIKPSLNSAQSSVNKVVSKNLNLDKMTKVRGSGNAKNKVKPLSELLVGL